MMVNAALKLLFYPNFYAFYSINNLFVTFQSYKDDVFIGGGSLINHEWVLTAAHLLADEVRVANWLDNILLTFGKTDRLTHYYNYRYFTCKWIYKMFL